MKLKKERAPHKFAGQQEGLAIVQWLNDEEPLRLGASSEERMEERRQESKTRKKIAQLIRKLNAHAEAYVRKKVDPELGEWLHQELARYPLKVTTVLIRDENKYKTFAEPRWIFGWYSSAGARAAEMIFGIVRLGERGLLARVRTCARCDRWFFAKFNHQRFCSKKCQLAHYQASEEWKERRRERYETDRWERSNVTRKTR